jgi:probable F420-dependent oxidoreductase
VRFSFVVFGVRPDHSTPLVVRAEQLGFDTVWFGDHVVTPMRIATPYPYSASGSAGYSPDTPLNDVWVSIAHAAAATTRIRLGTSVLILPLRHPATVAQAAATAQNMSGGRIAVGVGAGWLREEFDALGIPFDTRGQRMDEALEVLRRLWSGEAVAYRGDSFSFPPLKIGITPEVAIPVSVGGASKPALRRAAHSDGWNGAEGSLEDALRHRATLHRLRTEAGREEDPFRYYVKPRSTEPDLLRRYADAGFTDLVVPFRALYRAGPPMTLPQQLAALEELAEAVMLPEFVA